MNKVLLSQLLTDVPHEVLVGGDVEIGHLALSSKDIKRHSLFIALPGNVVDGRDFVTAAVSSGAVAALVEREGLSDDQRQELHSLTVPVIAVPQLRSQLGEMAATFWQWPSKSLSVIGVTGTNGKTSVSQYIAQILSILAAPESVRVMGTLGVGLPDNLVPTINTTLDAIANQNYLAKWREEKVRYVSMEVSSHALVQHRVRGIAFQVAIFTNLTRDHIDYHGDFEAYAAAKKTLLTDYGAKHIVINLDDERGRKWVSTHLSGEAITYGFSESAMVRARDVTASDMGQAFVLEAEGGEWQCHVPLLGKFNISNVLAAVAAVRQLGFAWEAIVPCLSELKPVPGRMEVLGSGEQPTVVVDYAHTPDALEQALQALRPHVKGRLWCVFGCGGDRDVGKRPLMGEVAERLADKVIVTDDNPRFEDGNRIIADILAGCQRVSHIVVERDRRAAIERAIRHASSDDIILIAGKGHERFQTISGRKLPHSDSEVAREILQEVSACT